MFDLDREVAAWSAAVYAERCQPAAGVEELSDHLYCEIDRARGEGLSEEEAFNAAIARLGSAPELKAEHAKNRSALGAACQVVAKADRLGASPEYRRLLLAHALVWAAVMIASALVLKKTAAPETFGWLLIGVFFPLWWASDQILRRAVRRRPAGGA
jgi:hypothetical protein